VAIQHLSITDFAKMPVPLPPLAEQRRIVSEADKCLSIVQELEFETERSVARAAALRAAILKSAFEPLLDRIVRVAAN
jgi:type I restriction enzyme S subunit